MFSRIVTVCLSTIVLTAPLVCASPFVEGNAPQKNEPKPAAVAARPQLPTMPLPPLPSSRQGNSLEPVKKRWNFVGKIDNRVIVTDTLSGDMLSLADGESLAGGCIATSNGVYCGKDATEKKRAPKVESSRVNEVNRLDELIFSAQNIAQKCIQLDETLKSEIVSTNSVLKDRESEIGMLKQELHALKQEREQMLVDQKILQEQLPIIQTSVQKYQSENMKYRDDMAFLLTTIALLKREKGAAYRLPGADGRIFRGPDGTTIMLNIKENIDVITPVVVPMPLAEASMPSADLNDRRNK